LKVNYTSYDVQCDSDTINPKTHPFVMVRSPEKDANSHPYWYAEVLADFHATVTHTGLQSWDPFTWHYMEFLWVRWLGIEPGLRSGRQYGCLPKVGFVPDTDPFAFGFLDPSFIIHGSHLIPSFADGGTTDLLSTTGPTLA
jgi:hypothetical protein